MKASQLIFRIARHTLHIARCMLHVACCTLMLAHYASCCMSRHFEQFFHRMRVQPERSSSEDARLDPHEAFGLPAGCACGQLDQNLNI